MKILLNEENEIIGYVTEGDLEGSIEVEIPHELLEVYEPRKLIYTNDKVTMNPNYVKEESIPNPPSNNVNGTDEELRKTYGNLQMSSVQTAKIVTNLAKQVTELTKQNVELQNQINNKGVE